ncbi:uncharacterized protein LOC128391345 isoform X2 [Panonychus citri]|uniref:uncharacterized protein LOC128391345 isoform X2 n=1 Tax=Panonychus citri TaxID=50023 RepID=UPI002307FE8D|nr:uncharacterized protein LOC128391345 isoform X2 [Panonychus citri]
MFIKRLRFSILSLLLTLISNNCYISFAQEIKDITTTGWTPHDLQTYPPKVNDEQYLYFAGRTTDLKGLKIEVKSIPTTNSETAKLSTASVTFDYWGYGGDPSTDADGYSATSFFSLGVSFQSEARPQTIWSAFNESTLGNKVGDLWGQFETISTEPIYPARIMITPILTSTEQFYYVALKGIYVNYNFEDSIIVTQNVTDATSGLVTEQNVTQPMDSTITLSCNSTSCNDFVLTTGANYHWSDLNFPTKPTTFSKFYTPSSSSAATSAVGSLSFTVSKSETTDSCVSINYWLTDGAHLTVTMGSSTGTLILGPTYAPSIADSRYDWYQTEFCLSQFFFNATDGDYKLTLTPSTVSAPDYIAIGEITTANARFPALAEPATKMILESWTKSSVSPTDEWFDVPAIGTASADSLTFKPVAPGNGMIYVVSSWFEMASGLELREMMTITSCPSKLEVTLQLIDSANNLIDTQSSDLCSTSSTTSSRKIYSITKGVNGQAYRLQFVISYNQNSMVTPVTLTLSAVDLSDACRLGRDECSGHGNCIVQSPNVASCECDSGYMDKDCSKPDWCVLKFPVTDSTTNITSEISGENYCTARGGTCNSKTFDPNTREICDCASTQYWKYDETLGHSCAAYDPCTGFNAFCPIGYVCSYSAVEMSASCSSCDTSNGYVKSSTGKCVKENACEKSPSPCVTGSSCKTDHNGVAVCYCTNGVIYDTTTGCDVDSCSWDTRKALGCDHTCAVELGQAECNCYPGWNITDGSKTACEQLDSFNCTSNCSTLTGSICVLDETTMKSVCSCLPGYVAIGTECVDICKGAAQNNTNAANQVKSICGTSTCTLDESAKLICECDSPYVKGPEGRCVIDTTCLEGGKGHSQCLAQGAICQPDLQAVGYNGDLWKCVCPPGTYKNTNGSCVDQCITGEKTCLFDNAVCQRSTVLGATSHECVCQPGLKKGTDNRCYLIEHSLRIEMVVRLEEGEVSLADTQLQNKITSYYMAPAVTDMCSRYAPLDISGCIDYLTSSAQEKTEIQKPAAMEAAIREMLKETLKSDLANVYGSTFGDINIINYSKLMTNSSSLGGDYKAIISLELSDPTIDATTHLTPLNDEAVCHSFPATMPEAESYCFIPTQSVIQRNSIVQKDLTPCNETYIDYCPSNTHCRSLDNSRFACDCNEGFRAETVIQMDSNLRTDYYKEYCEDIDECSSANSPCRQHSTCINTIGSYLCPCNHEYIEDSVSGTCISVCSTVKCVYGDCFVVANNTGACRCHEGYRGETCEDQDPLVTTFRTALITVAVVLGLLLIGVVLVSIILIKKAEKSSKLPPVKHIHGIPLTKVEQLRGPLESSHF